MSKAQPLSDTLEFAVEHDVPIRYLHRISTYYQALGYGKPYEWAHFADVPFTPLAKPLADSRVALITTAAPFQPDKGDQGPGAPYNAAAKFYRVYTDSTDNEPDLRVSHIGIDRKHTTAKDINTWFPLKQLKRTDEAGRIGSITPRFYGAPTNRSQRTTVDQDCAELLEALRADKADVAVIVAN
jgi:D-proline reductase (dithiol) PrdB